MSFDQATNRRRFLQFLASSPLFAAGGFSAFANEGPLAPNKLPDPIMWAPLKTEDLIKSPKDAINVFDFEPVMRMNVPPAHFGYMASGIDDEVTLRAQPRGLPEVPAAPAPPRRRQQGRHEHRDPRREIRYADRHCADRQPEGLPRGGRSRRRQGGKVGNHLQILSTADHLAPRTSSPRAARRSGISSTPPTSGRSRRRS